MLPIQALKGLAGSSVARVGGRISAAGRARIAAASPARWAKRRDNKIADYRIKQGGTVVVYLSEKATNWVTGPKPAVGARLTFKDKI